MRSDISFSRTSGGFSAHHLRTSPTRSCGKCTLIARRFSQVEPQVGPRDMDNDRVEKRAMPKADAEIEPIAADGGATNRKRSWIASPTS